jgi:hypothetical protein
MNLHKLNFRTSVIAVILAFTSLFAILLPIVTVNAVSAQIEVISIEETSSSSFEITFSSRIVKKQISHFTITASPDLSGITQSGNSSLQQNKQISKKLNRKATGLIIYEFKPIPTAVPYTFKVCAKITTGKTICSDSLKHPQYADLLDQISRLPSDWGNPKPIQLPTPTPTPAPAAAVVYAVGDRGPGGGIVYYVSATNFTSTGSACNTTCKYLEVAPSTWQGTGVADDLNYVWSDNVTVATGQDTVTASAEGVPGRSYAPPKFNWKIGQGFYNTSVMKVAGATSPAQDAVLAYAGNSTAGQWFIPSLNELNELCKYAHGQTTGNLTEACTPGVTFKSTANAGGDLGGFVLNYYASSSERDAGGPWLVGFSAGNYRVYGKSTALPIRPVRAF